MVMHMVTGYCGGAGVGQGAVGKVVAGADCVRSACGFRFGRQIRMCKFPFFSFLFCFFFVVVVVDVCVTLTLTSTLSFRR